LAGQGGLVCCERGEHAFEFCGEVDHRCGDPLNVGVVCGVELELRGDGDLGHELFAASVVWAVSAGRRASDDVEEHVQGFGAPLLGESVGVACVRRR
jgi:hypothetical protein